MWCLSCVSLDRSLPYLGEDSRGEDSLATLLLQ